MLVLIKFEKSEKIKSRLTNCTNQDINLYKFQNKFYAILNSFYTTDAKIAHNIQV